MSKKQNTSKSPNTSLYAVILAGGSGTRFWPLSRQMSPKQMLRIDSDDTLVQRTVKRVNGLIPLNKVYIVTNENHYLEMKMQLASLGDDSGVRPAPASPPSNGSIGGSKQGVKGQGSIFFLNLKARIPLQPSALLRLTFTKRILIL